MTPTQATIPDQTVELYRSYKEIAADYVYDPDIMSEEDERARRVKWIIDNVLSKVDKTLILLYTDCGSYRKLGKRMRLSHMTARKEILRIKAIILAEYAKMTKGQK